MSETPSGQAADLPSLAILAELTAELCQSRDIDGVGALLAQRLRGLFTFDRGVLLLRVPESGRWTLRDLGSPGRDLSEVYEPSSPLVRRALEGQPVQTQGEEPPESTPDQALVPGAGSVMLWPCRWQDGLIAVLCLSRRDAAPYPGAQASLAAQLALQLGGIIAHHQAHARLVSTREELRDARQEAKAAMEARTQFLARMSHEMRTPLAGIIGMANLLRTTPLSGVQQEFADTIRSSGDTLLHFLNDLLDLAKIESGALELEWQPFSLRDCVDEALDVVSIRAADARLQLGATIDPALPAWALGDAMRLRQILVNLLGNAVKFTARGQVWVTVCEAPAALLAAHRTSEARPPEGPPPGGVLFTVRDTGIGIPENRLDRLFVPYSQVDASTTRKYGGTGLGLAICRQLTDQMGGAIWAESVENQGSAFHVLLPFVVVEPPTDAIYLPHASPARVLLVTPHEDLRRSLASLLPLLGVDQAEVIDARALLEIDPGHHPGVVLLDHAPPEQDALALAQKWEQRYPSSSCPVFPVILASSRDQLGLERRLVKSPVHVVRKPVRWLRLADAMGVRWSRSVVPPLPHDPGPFGPLASQIPLHILVVEDTPMLQRVLVLLLEQLGYEATLARNGQEALELASSGAFDLIWMDVQMPDVDGLEVTRRLRAARLPRRPWIVAMTASALDQDRRECLDAGMDDFVSKPASRAQLAAAIQRAGHARHLTEGLPAAHQLAPLDAAAIDRIGELFGDAAEFSEFLRQLASSTARLLDAIFDAHASRQLSGVGLAAHSFKGTAAQVGAQRVVELTQAIEEAATAGDLRQVGQWLQPLREAQQDLEAELLERAGLACTLPPTSVP